MDTYISPASWICILVRSSHGRYVPVYEVHHIIPISEGGTNDEKNLESLCRSCHEKIHEKRGDR